MARVKQTARKITVKAAEKSPAKEIEKEKTPEPEPEVEEQVEPEEPEAEMEEVEEKVEQETPKTVQNDTGSIFVYVEGTPRFKISFDNGDTIATIKAVLPKLLKKMNVEITPSLSRFFLIAGDASSEVDINGEENDELEIAAETEKSELYLRRYLFTTRKLNRLYPSWQEEMESITIALKNKLVQFDIPDADLSKPFSWENEQVKSQIGRKRKFADDFFLAWFEPELVEFMKTNERPIYQLSSTAELTPITGEKTEKAKRGRKPKAKVEEEEVEEEDEQKTEEVDESKGKEEADEEEEEEEEDEEHEEEAEQEDEE